MPRSGKRDASGTAPSDARGGGPRGDRGGRGGRRGGFTGNDEGMSLYLCIESVLATVPVESAFNVLAYDTESLIQPFAIGKLDP